MPTITDPVTIDGYSQDGATQNTLQIGTNAQPMIVLDGSQAGNAHGLALTSGASGSVIKGLNIQGFFHSGIQLYSNVSEVKIEGNFIGTDPSGTQDRGNGGNGIRLTMLATTPSVVPLLRRATSSPATTSVASPPTSKVKVRLGKATRCWATS